MKFSLSLLALCLGVFSVQAAPEYGTVIVSKVISVYDGDTFRVDIDFTASYSWQKHTH